MESLASPYAEAAHIRPPGAPHDGLDTSDYILCLCPNHFILLDHGGVGIGEDLSLDTPMVRLWGRGVSERACLVYVRNPIARQLFGL